MFNSYIIHQKVGGKFSKQMLFRKELIEQIIEPYRVTVRNNNRGGRPCVEQNIIRLSERHFPSKVPATYKKANRQRVCIVCSKKKDNNGKKIRRESRFQCLECGVGLCVDPCFKICHTIKNF